MQTFHDYNKLHSKSNQLYHPSEKSNQPCKVNLTKSQHKQSVKIKKNNSNHFSEEVYNTFKKETCTFKKD